MEFYPSTPVPRTGKQGDVTASEMTLEMNKVASDVRRGWGQQGWIRVPRSSQEHPSRDPLAFLAFCPFGLSRSWARAML